MCHSKLILDFVLMTSKKYVWCNGFCNRLQSKKNNYPLIIVVPYLKCLYEANVIPSK